ncbi:hypothetical protein ACG83_10870 [Frankia sp. R43]|uniref:hypothetical protein n=1 Tax=Frankia sp. R43 TaxID=269536 RepID=UPI0006DAB431|nr:hypothetical protein [Frankia sp. R43]KPM55767.1 hypothetical protein ACG83_10870 [Frankia sp. R43]
MPESTPPGTVARDIEIWGEPGADHYVRPGTLGTFGPLRWWRVQGTETVGERAGSSCAFAPVGSPDEARAQIAELRADPERARYDTWEIIHMESLIRTSLVPLEPAPAELGAEGCHRCNGSGVVPTHDGEDEPCSCRHTATGEGVRDA